MGCAASAPVHHHDEPHAASLGAAAVGGPQTPSKSTVAKEAQAAEDPGASDVSSPAKAHESNGGAAGMSPQRRRLSVTGGPAGTKALTPAQDARRRRLSLATTPATAALDVVRENALVDPNNDPNMPIFEVNTAAALPLKWVVYSRPGNDPMKRVKENQDAFAVVDEYGGHAGRMFFAVCDGHGPNGGHASGFVKQRLPDSWLASGDVATDPFVAMNRGCITTNQELSMSSIDVYTSGTTAITSMLSGNHLFVANVGDSRAVLARMSTGGALRALDLSSDHKPDRPDERERIESYGGRVFEWGVPRVWLKDVDMPGLAMSRSFGDIAAESVGVYAEPELSSVELGPLDRFIIWASDGVWEFISSQEAVDIVASHAEAGPLEAAAALVRASVNKWHDEEDVVDDITCVIAFVNFS